MKIPAGKREGGAPARTPPIVHMDMSHLSPGILGRHFRDGAVAAVIGGNGEVASLWQALIGHEADMPWKSALYDLCANLMPHDDLTRTLGDMYYFKPGRHSYIARKIEIRPEGRELKATPDTFRGSHGTWRMSEQLRERCWHFSLSIMNALAPADRDPGAPWGELKAVVQQIKYHDSVAGHEALYLMVRNSLGPWARIGYGLDRRREELCGPLGRRGIADTLALLSLLPPLRFTIDGLNRLAGHFDRRAMVPDGYHLLVKAHVDTRYFSALCGSRHNLRTEVFADGRWLPLPVNDTDIIVLPGSRARMAYGIRPTLHRVLQARDGGPAVLGKDSPNVTLLLGAK